MDTVSKKRRSEIMRLVKSRDTKIELKLRKLLRSRGLRFAVNDSKILGKPDIAFRRAKVAVFIDSCFWHGCKTHCRYPTANKIYWRNKIARNKKRDSTVSRGLKKEGWRVLRVWEHSLGKSPDTVARRIERFLS